MIQDLKLLFPGLLFKNYLSAKRCLEGAEASEGLFINHAIFVDVLEFYIISHPVILVLAAQTELELT